MLLFFRRHFIAIILAFIVGGIIYLPQYLLVSQLGSDYQGIEVAGNDTEEYYLNRVREAYDGYYSLASPEHFEYKSGPYAQPGLAEIVLSQMAKITRTGPARIVSYGKFLFPALLFFVLYAIGYHLTHSRMVGLVSGAFIVLASNLLYFPQDIIQVITFQLEDLKEFLPYTRPIHPQASSLLFYFWFFLLMLWIEKGSRKLLLPLGVILGLMFYTYLYSWTLAYGILGVLFFLGILKKHILPRKFQIITIAATGFIISIPYWMNFFEMRESPYYPNLQKLYGFYSSREPLWSNLLFLDLIILVAWYWRKKKDLVFYIFLSIIIALAFLLNQQVITGIRFYPGHWHWYYTVPFTFLFVIFGFFYFLRGFAGMFIYRLAGTLLVAIAVMNGFSKQYNSFYGVYDQSVNDQRYADVFEWFNRNSKKDDVVLAHDRLSMQLPTYTHGNNYLSNWPNLYLTPPERLEDMAFTFYYLDGATPENAVEYLKTENRFTRILLYGYYKLRTGQCANGCYTPEEIQGLAKKYSEFYKSLDFEKHLKKYRVDYVFWDPRIRPKWNIGKIKIFSYLLEINGVKIYKVI